MTQPQQHTAEELPERIEAEAVAWIARLHNDQRTPEDERSFNRWLSESRLHRIAFEKITDAWDASGGPESGVRLDVHPRYVRASRLRPYVWALAATLAIAALGLSYFLREDAIITGVGERRDIALPDGSHLTLNTATRLKIQYDEQRRLIRLESGEAFFEVASRAGKPFIVKTSDGDITALGTSFSVRTERARTEVTLVEGRVSVAPAVVLPVEPGKAPQAHSERALSSTRHFVLIPGQRLTLASKKATRIDQPIVEKLTAWRQGLIALDRTPLAEAVAEMNRYSAVKLVAAPEIAYTIQVSGMFHAGDSLDFAQGLASSHGLKVSQEKESIILAQ